MCMCLTHYNYVIGFTQYLQLSPTHRGTCVSYHTHYSNLHLTFAGTYKGVNCFKFTKMISLKIFLVLVLVHEGKNNYSLVLVLVSILKWWTTY